MIHCTPLADAIVTFLQGKNLAGSPAIARKRIVDVSLDKIVGTLVTVIPFGPALTLEAVGVAQNDLDIRIVVQRKLDGDPDGEIADAAAELVDTICDLLIGATVSGIECKSVKATPSYDPAKIDATLDLFDATILTVWEAIDDGLSD